jgi:hypothetical protein
VRVLIHVRIDGGYCDLHCGVDGLAGQALVKHAPVLFENWPIESSLVSDVRSWMLDGALCRTDHVLDLKKL